MPLFEYRCRACDATFETLVRSGSPVACPRCDSAAVDKLLSLPTVLSGQTARPAGHTCCGQTERCDAPPCSTGGSCRHT